MYWFKRDWWKASIATASMLLLLILIVWVPVSVAGAYEGASGSAMPRTIMVQVTPTEDAVVTALNREKLKGEIVQQQHTWDNWLWNFGATILSTLAVALAGVLGFLRYLRDQRIEREKRREDRQTEQEKRDQEQQRWLKDQEAEREKRAEERFQVTVAGLGDTKEGARIGAAILLRTFLRPGYKQFYIQTFDLAVANLCPTETPIPPEDSKTPLPLTTLRQALIVIFKEAFPLAQSQNKGSPQSLDASFILLDSAYLRKANLNQVWMPEVALRHADLSDANLSQAMLKQANLSGADLRGANLRGANLREANLHGADLRRAVLDQADLRGADLKETDLSNMEQTLQEQI